MAIYVAISTDWLVFLVVYYQCAFALSSTLLCLARLALLNCLAEAMLTLVEILRNILWRG